LTSFGQRNINIGQGILKIDFEKLPVINFFADTLKSRPIKTISVTRDKEGEFIIKNHVLVSSWFKPEGLWLTYSIFVIRVDTIAGKWFRVFINNDKGTTLWTKDDPTKKFVKWQTFLVKETTTIDKNPDFSMEIKSSPSDSSATIKRIEKTDCFEALEIKGDWMRIRTNTTLDCNESKRIIKSGWIKWRQNNRLTLNYGMTC
jgi:hypothetical protein